MLEPALYDRFQELCLRIHYMAPDCASGNMRGVLDLMLAGALELIEAELARADDQPAFGGLLDHGKLPGYADPDAELTMYNFGIDPGTSFRLDLAMKRSSSVLTRGHLVELCVGELVPVIEALTLDTLTDDAITAACKAHCDAIASAHTQEGSR